MANLARKLVKFNSSVWVSKKLKSSVYHHYHLLLCLAISQLFWMDQSRDISGYFIPARNKGIHCFPFYDTRLLLFKIFTKRQTMVVMFLHFMVWIHSVFCFSGQKEIQKYALFWQSSDMFDTRWNLNNKYSRDTSLLSGKSFTW